MLTDRMMIQAIVDRMAGMEVTLKEDQFRDPWRTCWQVVETTESDRIYFALHEALGEHPERDAIIQRLVNGTPGAALGRYPSFKEIQDHLPPITYLWDPWLPNGMLTMVGAAPGVGKSYVMLYLINQIIEGRPFPDGHPGPEPGRNVIYVDAENAPQLHAMRCESLEMDTEKLFMMQPPEGVLIDLELPEQQAQLIEMVATLNPVLVVIDSLSSAHMGGENNVEDVRDIMMFLNNLAQYYNIAVVLVHHIRKRNSQQMEMFDLSMDDLSGSGYLQRLPRVIWGMSVVRTGPSLDRNGPRKVEVLKNNLSQYPEPLSFEFVPRHPTGVLLRWSDDVPEPFKKPTEVEKCADYIVQILRQADGPLAPKDVIERAKANGFSESTVRRAKRDKLLGVVLDTCSLHDPSNEWELNDV